MHESFLFSFLIGVEDAFSFTSKVMTVSLHKFSPGFFPGKLNLRRLCSFGSRVTCEASVKASPIPAVHPTCLTASFLDPGEGREGALHVWHFPLSGLAEL